jgi:hypothetical protein
MFNSLMIKFLAITVIGLLAGNAVLSQNDNTIGKWRLFVLPSSLRLDPVTNKIIEERFSAVNTGLQQKGNLLEKNWVYDGNKVSLKSARGEYVSFQLVITNNYPDSILQGIKVEMPSFHSKNSTLITPPELFLEWAVNVKTPSTGYPKASLGTGWYPDALIPFNYIQDDSLKAKGRLIYRLYLPDFNNRIDSQKSLIIWVDQYILFESSAARAGHYSTTISVAIAGQTQKIPVS